MALDFISILKVILSTSFSLFFKIVAYNFDYVNDIPMLRGEIQFISH